MLNLAHIKKGKGNAQKAKEFFERGRNNGARGKWIFPVFRNKKITEKLIKTLESLGPPG